MVATTLGRGDLAIIQVDSEDSDDPFVSGTQNMSRDTISFVLLSDVGQDTKVFFTDRAWNGSAFSVNGTDGTYTWTAASDLPAGTVITITDSEMNAAGIELADTGEAIYAYQGAADSPTHFLFAVEFGDGNDTFNSSLVNTGLSVGNGAMAIAEDNSSYGERTWNQQHDLLFQQISDQSNWNTNDNSPQVDQVENTNLFVAPDVQLWIAGISGGHGIISVSGDATQNGGLGYDVQTYFQNTFNDGDTTTYTQRFWDPTHIVFDTVAGKFFMVDSSGSRDRVLQGNISDLLTNTGTAPTMTILWQDSPAGTSDGDGVTSIALDKTNGDVYFTADNTLLRVDYNTANQTAVVLANLGNDPDDGNKNYANELALDLTNGRAFIVNTESTSDYILVPVGTPGSFDPGDGSNVLYTVTMSQNSLLVVEGISASDTGSAGNTVTQINFTEAFDDDDNLYGDQLNEFNDYQGKITDVDINTTTGEIWFTATQLYSGVSGSVGGIYKGTYNNATHSFTSITQVYSEGDATNRNFLHINVDEETGTYYVSSQEPNGNHAVYRGLLTDGANTAPTLYASLPNINDMTPEDLLVESAPTLSGTALGPTIVEQAGNPSPNPAAVTPANAFQASDLDAHAPGKELAGAQVRVSDNFLSGTGHADQLLYGGTLASGTNQNGTISINGDTVSFSYNAATGVLTFTGITTFDNYETILANVQFRADGDNPTDYGAAGTRTISYSVFDGLLYSDEVNATVTVTGVNDAPINSVPGAQTFDEDTTRVFSTANGNALSVSDVDADPAAQALQVTLSVTHGTLTLASTAGLTFSTGDGSGDGTMTFTGTANAIDAALGAGGLTYTPIADYNGSDTLTFTVNDQGFNGNDAGLSGNSISEQDSDTVSFTINAVTDIADDSATTNEDTAVNISVQANDSFENPAHAISAYTQGSHGTVTLSDAGTAADTTDDYLVYTPNADFNGTDSFTYTITSGGVTETATAHVTINAVADIVDDTVTVTEDTPGHLDLLSNDSFEDTGRSITAVGAASHGTTSINDNGTVATSDDYVVYTPDADYNGTDSFTYTVTAGGVTETATVNVTVDAVADIVDDTVTVNEDSGTTSLDLLANDGFEDPGHSITSVSAATNGTVTLNDNGTVETTDDYVTYTPNADYNGSDSFTYTVTSGGVTETATVNVTVNSVNDAPTSAGLDGDSVTWTESDAPVALDAGGDASVADIDSPDFNGGQLTVAITAGFAAGEDQLQLGAGATLSAGMTVGSDVTVGGHQIGTISAVSDDSITVDFNASASQADVSALLSAVTYANNGGDDPTAGDRTVSWTLVDGGGTANGGSDTLNLTTTVHVVAVDDPSVAQDDVLSTDANAILNADLFADNGNGPDTDPDSPLVVTAVNGSSAGVGSSTTLTSGATVTVNDDGSASYDPNGQYDYLISASKAAQTGAVNTSASDGFTYELNGTETATVSVTINGVDGAGDQLWGDGSDNTMNGTTGADFFRLTDGGDDTVDGGTGNDAFYMGAAFSPGDTLTGGGGYDQLGLQGNYGSAGTPLVLNDTSFSDMDIVVLISGGDDRFGDTAGNDYSYYLKTADGNVAAGQQLVVSWNNLGVNENVSFDGSAETDGSFLTYGGKGTDTIVGSQQADGFYFGYGMWGASDSVDGQAGDYDQLGLQGDYTATGTGAIVFGAGQLLNMDVIVCMTGGDARFGAPPGVGYSYDLTMNDDNVAAGETMYISANTLRAAGGTLVSDEALKFDGSAEHDGNFVIYAGHGADTIIGSSGDDQIWGGQGGDTLTGGLGNDSFLYSSVSGSTSTAMDHILDFSTGDRIDLSAIDAISGGLNNTFSFIDGAAFSHTAGELRAFEQSPGEWQVEADTNGDGTADMVIAVTTDHALTSSDFVL